MDKESLERKKEILNAIKNKLGIPVLSTALIISIISCHHNKVKNNTETNITTEQITEALTEYTTEEVTEALTEYTTEEVTEALTEYTTEKNIEYNANDEEILNMFKEYKENINELISKEDIENAKIKGREYFITLVDFIFYNSEIKGITFDELKEESKQELFTELCEMDEIISSVAPDYKDNLSERYTLVKDFTKSKYYSSLDRIREYIGEEKYDKIKEFKDNTKEKVIDFKDEHQEDIDNIKENAKEKTSEYKLKLKNWYEDYKEK